MSIDFREKGMEGEGGKHWLVAFSTGSDWDQTHNPSMCPDWELNLWPFGAQDDAPTNRVTLARGIM